MRPVLLKGSNATYLFFPEEESTILSGNKFSTVYVAKNGKEGLRTYLENQDDINLILSDGGNKRLEISLKFWKGYSKYLRNQSIAQNNKADFYDMLVKISEEKLNDNG